jgi:hypothetical protein
MITAGLASGGGKSGEKRKMLKRWLSFPLYLLKWIFIIGAAMLLVCLCCLAMILLLVLIVEFIGTGVISFIIKAIGASIIASLITICAIEDWNNKHK